MENKNLSGGEFLIKDSTPESVIITADFNEEQKMMSEMCREFIENEVAPNLDRIDKQEEGLMETLLNKAGELGLLAIALPEAYGGFAKDFVTNTLVTEVVGTGYSFSVALLAHTGIGTLPILYFGTDEQKNKYLPKLASGEYKASYCLTEPGSGSDALAAKTKAVLNDAKTHYILNGQKMWITNAGFADVFIVFAKIDGEQFTGFILEKGMQGLTLGEEENKMGIKGSSTRQVFMEDTPVPVENVLGEIGKGHLIAFNILNIGRLKLGAAALGNAKLISTISIKYANERQQFKQPISNFGAIQYKIAEQAIRSYACETALYRTAEYIDQKEKALVAEGKNYSEALLGAAKEYAAECAILKVYGSEVLDYVTDEGVQIHGGYGFSEEYAVARAYRDSRINRIFEGTNEINRMLLVDTLLKKAMKKELDLFSAAKGVQKELSSIMSILGLKKNTETGIFKNEIYAVKNFKKLALMLMGAAAMKFKRELEKEQQVLMLCADLIIEAFLAESVLLATQKLVTKEGAGKVESQINMAKVFIFDALDRNRASAKNLVYAIDSGKSKMIMMGVNKLLPDYEFNTKVARRQIAKKLIEENKYCF